MGDDHPAKYWWVVLVVVPLGVAIIAILPDFRGSGDDGERGNSISIEGSRVDGDVQIVGTQVVMQQLRDAGADEALAVKVEAGIERATNLARGRFYDEAITAFTTVLAQYPNAAVYNNLAALYLVQDRVEDAERALMEGVALDPAFQPLHVNLARVYEIRGMTAAAAAQLEQAPDEPQGRVILERITRRVNSGAVEQEPNGSALSPNRAPLDLAIAGFIDTPRDIDFFSFTTPAMPRDRISVELSNRSTELRPRLVLLGGAKEMLWATASHAYEVTPGQDLVRVSSLKPGTDYYLSVAALGGSGSYQLKIRPLRAFDQYEPNDSIQDAYPIADSAAVAGNLMDEDDSDFYRFESTAPGFDIELQNASSSLQPRVRIWRADKSREWQNAGYAYNVTPGQDVTARLETVPGPVFYLSVSSFGGHGDYTLRAAPVQ